MSEEEISNNENERIIFETECGQRRNYENQDLPIPSFDLKKLISIDNQYYNTNIFIIRE